MEDTSVRHDCAVQTKGKTNGGRADMEAPTLFHARAGAVKCEYQKKVNFVILYVLKSTENSGKFQLKIKFDVINSIFF